MAVKNLLDSWFKDIDNCLHDNNHLISRILDNVEQKLKIKREYIVYGVVIAFAVYLIFGNFAATVCNFAGFAYPAYVSMKAVESRELSDDTQWLTYWCVFAIFALIDTVSEAVLSWFPIYWLAKFIFLVWLYLPSTKGAQKIYNMFLAPFMKKYSKKIDDAGYEIEGDLKKVAAELRSEIGGLRERMDSLTSERLQNYNNNNKDNRPRSTNGHPVEPEKPQRREEPKHVNQNFAAQPTTPQNTNNNEFAHPDHVHHHSAADHVQGHHHAVEEPKQPTHPTNNNNPPHPVESNNGVPVKPLTKDPSNLKDEVLEKRVTFNDVLGK